MQFTFSLSTLCASTFPLTHFLQMKVTSTLLKLPFTPEHFACTQNLHLLHLMEFLFTRVPHTEQGSISLLYVVSAPSPIIIFVLPTFTLRPLLSKEFFHSVYLLFNSGKLSAIITKSSAYSNSNSKPRLTPSLSTSMTVMNNRGDNTDP